MSAIARGTTLKLAMPFEELTDEGQRLVTVFQEHWTPRDSGKACNCADCKQVRRSTLVCEVPIRPECHGKEMRWFGHECEYVCDTCGRTEK